MDKAFLKSLLSLPTAPYRESIVMSWLSERLEAGGVSHFFDPVGNLVVGARSEEDYRAKLNRESTEPVRLFIAHTDHPGFHGVAWKGKKGLSVKWFGGAPTKHLVGASVWLATKEGLWGEGKLEKPKLNKAKTTLAEAEVKFKKPIAGTPPDPVSLFGGFRFRAPVWNKGSLWYTKAADDLIGAGVIASLAIELQGKGEENSFLAVLTRAEEVGFIGAIGHFELGWLEGTKRKVFCVSLETSRTLPGALVGSGPVVRLGDRATVFDPGATQVMTSVAAAVLNGKYQRRIMDGGTCEATVAVAFGFPAMGISVPLGNYHNQSFEGGPDSRGKLGPAPEFVHWKDIEGMEALCRGLLKPGWAWTDPWAKRVGEFREKKQKAAELLALI